MEHFPRYGLQAKSCSLPHMNTYRRRSSLHQPRSPSRVQCPFRLGLQAVAFVSKGGASSLLFRVAFSASASAQVSLTCRNGIACLKRFELDPLPSDAARRSPRFSSAKQVLGRERSRTFAVSLQVDLGALLLLYWPQLRTYLCFAFNVLGRTVGLQKPVPVWSVQTIYVSLGVLPSFRMFFDAVLSLARCLALGACSCFQTHAFQSWVDNLLPI